MADDAVSTRGRGKRDRLLDAACDLVYRQGIERTTLAEIADAAEVPLGNVYYYFKTKDQIVVAVVDARVGELHAALSALERAHRTPTTRLKGLLRFVASQGSVISRLGCQYGTLCTDLVKHTGGVNPHAARLMETLVDWAAAQFRAMGRRDAPDLAVQFVAAYQGSAVVSNALGQPDLMARQVRRIERWIDGLDKRRAVHDDHQGGAR
jgi:TetR/AcrR family transcriptional regulator, transcriptional repressor for nem operon